jgi:probable rRNA maturation factor
MILNRQRKVRVALHALDRFLRQVEKELRVGRGDVTVCFVSDGEIARMNEEFRAKKGPTDVLSFPARAQSKGKKARSTTGEHYLGDVAIAPETARRYAKKNGRSVDNELRVLILHGVLHLLGYDHETDHGEMDRIEQKMRRRFDIA